MHIPVLLEEVLEYLKPQPGQHFIDCTVGEGGHAAAILEKTAPEGRLLAIDRDGAMLERARITLQPYGDRVLFVRDTYANLSAIYSLYDFPKAHGILFDLGISSWHLEESHGGFSFQREETLDMRFDREDWQAPSAQDIVNRWREEDLAHIFSVFGEERFANRIAHAISDARTRRSITTAKELALLVERAIPRQGRLHPATRIFQALRIVVNKELEMLEHALPQAIEVMVPEGRVAVISYHSLEDRVVKFFFRNAAANKGGIILTGKPVTPQEKEIAANPRARSAKLRVFQKSN